MTESQEPFKGLVYLSNSLILIFLYLDRRAFLLIVSWHFLRREVFHGILSKNSDVRRCTTQTRTALYAEVDIPKDTFLFYYISEEIDLFINTSRIDIELLVYKSIQAKFYNM